MAQPRPLSSFSCLTFDCFGTLVDWESGIYRALSPLTHRLPPSHFLRNDRSALLKAFVAQEHRVQTAYPNALYNSVLATAFDNLATELGVLTSEDEKRHFGASVGDWPAFTDTVDALKRLQQHFKIVTLSNVDRESFARTLSGPLAGVEFDAIYTAQEIGSYKPNPRNFHYLIDHCDADLGIPKHGIIHTAQSLFHNIVPATAAGMISAWIERGEEAPSVMGGDLASFEGTAKFAWRYKNLKAMADALESS